MNKIKKVMFESFIPALGKVFSYKNKYINVIYYHDIVRDKGYGSQKTNIDIFKKQMEYIKKEDYITLTFDELNEETLKGKQKRVLITFDDGWRSNYTEIFAFMKELGVKYNIFLEGNNVGTNEEYLTWDMVREMHESGFVGFGAHTFSHVDASDISKIDPETEFDKTNQIIEKEAGITPKDFCYPYGKWSEKSNEFIIKNTDYTRIYTSSMMFSYDQDGKIIFGRSSINGDRNFSVFKNMLNGNYNVFRSLRR